MTGTPEPADDPRASIPRFVARTVLLFVSIALLFPNLLDRFTAGAWARWVNSLGAGRWAAWGACFVAMMVLRFAGGPKRGE